MRKFIFTLICLLTIHAFADSGEFQPAKPPEELPRKYIDGFVQNLNRQSEKIQKQSTRTCEASYQHIFAKDEVRISLFYGYLDYEDVSMDPSLATVMMEHLQKPCGPERPNIEACGFQIVKSEKGLYQLKKQMKVAGKDKTILLDIMNPSLTWDDRANRSVQNLYFDQKQRSIQTEEAFYESIKSSDVVFYDGHSRMGAGPDFHPYIPVKMLWDKMTQKRVTKFIDNIAQSQNLKILGLFACETEKHYEPAVLQAAPHLGVITSTANVATVTTEESVFGSLNAILARRCKADFVQATVPETAPNEDIIRVKNFFEYSRSPTPAKTAASKETLKVTKADGRQ